MKDKAMLVVSFGTSFWDTLEKNIAALEERLKSEFSGYDHFRAFTSGMIRKKIRERDGISIDSTEEALMRLSDMGYKEIMVVPTHIIPGEEYDDVVEAVCRFTDKFEGISVSEPLLSSDSDYEAVTRAISIRFAEMPDGSAAVLMGHGSAHAADHCYERMQSVFDSLKLPYYMATVEGSITLESILPMIKKSGAKEVILYPFMLVAGDHAVNDMAGDDDDSFKSVMLREGYSVRIIMEGLGENEAITEIYVKHVHEAVGKFTCR